MIWKSAVRLHRSSHGTSRLHEKLTSYEYETLPRRAASWQAKIKCDIDPQVPTINGASVPWTESGWRPEQIPRPIC